LERVRNIYFFPEKWREKANEVKMDKVACYGEPLVTFYEAKHSEGKPKIFKMDISGDALNVALQISKLGHSSKYISRVGTDLFGARVMDICRKYKIDASNVILDPAHKTGLVFVIFDEKGDHRFIYKRENSASANYSIEDAKKVNLDEVKIFHLSGISQAISKSSLEASFYLMEICKSKRIKISYDLNYREPLWNKDYFSSIARYTLNKYADIVLLTYEEAKTLGISKEPKKIVEEILAYGPELVALKLGEKGCLIGNTEKIIPGKPIKVHVVDTVGAGDAFAAAVITSILEEMDSEKIANYANLVASFVCKSEGATEGQPTKADLKNFLKLGGDYKAKSDEKNKNKSKFNKGRQ